LVPQLYSRRWPRASGYAPNLLGALQTGTADLCHTHGIWMWPSAAVHRWHIKTGRPYFISPRGMLDPWALTRSRLKKWVASRWFEAAHLRDAACLHALCESEAESMRAYGLTNPICVIPNGIDVPESLDRKIESQKPQGSSRNRDGVKTLLFIGRLHPKKGLVGALKAWAAVNAAPGSTAKSDWCFAIAGWDQQGHEAELRKLCDQLGLRHRCTAAADFLAADDPNRSGGSVVFLGPAFGKVKDTLLRQASAFILPSYSEGLPMAVLEAWAYQLPVLMTQYCNLPEGFTTGAAIRIGTDSDSIVAGMRSLASRTDLELTAMGQCGRRLVEERFTWREIANQMRDVYAWVLGGGTVPECVRIR